jgi:WD40 repeat protein
MDATRYVLTAGLLAWWVIVGPLTGPGAVEPVQSPPANDDANDEPLPPGVSLRLGSTRLRTGAQVGGVAFSPNGKLLAACGADGVVRFWDTATGKETRAFRAHRWGGKGLAFSPDGKLFAVGSSNSTTSLWDVASGKELQRLRHPAYVEALAFSPDGTVLAVGDSKGGLGLWDLAKGQVLHQLQPHANSWTWTVAFAPDGKTVASASYDSTLHLFDVATGKQLATIDVQTNGFTAVGFSRDGKAILSGNHDGRVRFWDQVSRKELRDLGAPRHGAAFFAQSADGKTLVTTGAGEQAARVWDSATGKEVRQFALAVPAQHLALSADGKLAATAGLTGNRIQVWDVATGGELFPSDGQAGPLTDVFVTPDGKTALTASTDCTARAWDLATGKVRRTFDGRAYQYFRAALSPDGKLVALGGSGAKVLLQELATGRPAGELTVDLAGVSALAFTADSASLVTAGTRDSVIRVRTLANAKETARLAGHTSSPFALAVSPDGKLLASGGQDRTVRIWDLAAAKELHQFTTETTVMSVAFSPDSKAVAAGGSSLVRIWDAISGQEWAGLAGHQGHVQCVAFSPDSRLLATGGIDHTVALWEVASGKPLVPPSVHRDICNCLAFSADGKTLVAGSFDTSALVWDLKSLAGAGKVKNLAAKELEALWGELAGDPGAAHRAIWVLAGQEKAVGFLKARLAGGPAEDHGPRLRKLIADLDDDDFHVREAASRDLAKLGAAALPALREALRNKPSLEVQRRIEALLEGQDTSRGEALTGDLLRSVRAVQVLERVGTPEAQELLRSLTKGPAERVAREAGEALTRLEKRGGKK